MSGIVLADQVLKVVLLANTILLDPVHALVSLLGPHAEIKYLVALLDVPVLEAQ